MSNSKNRRKKGLIVLGIDPGLKIIGYGAVAKREGKIECLGYGKISLKSGGPDSYPDLFRQITSLLKKYRPDMAAIETLYARRNLKRALALAEIRGVIALACRKLGINMKDMAPAAVKRVVGGYGRASKAGLAKMVRLILELEETPTPDDAADALALAISATMGYKGLILRQA